MSDPLSILFGSAARVKLLRFFLFNPSKEFLFDDISRRAKLVRRTARTELGALERADVIYRKQIYEISSATGNKRKAVGYALNKRFSLLEPLQHFFFVTAPINRKTVLRHVRKAGTFDFMAIAGVFVGEFESKVDIFLVSKKEISAKVEQAIRGLEAELGIEIKYAFLETEDFIYRVGMRDKLLRNIFDYDHEIIVDKIGMSDGITG